MKNENKSQECTNWTEVLALTPVEMLPLAQQEALAAHTQHCQECEALVAQYKGVDQMLLEYFTTTHATQESVSWFSLLSGVLTQKVKTAYMNVTNVLSASPISLFVLGVTVLGFSAAFIWHLPLSYIGVIAAFVILLKVELQWTMPTRFALAGSGLQTPEGRLLIGTSQPDTGTSLQEHEARDQRAIEGQKPFSPLDQKPSRRRGFWLVVTVLVFVVSVASLGAALLNQAKPSANIGISIDGSRAFDLDRPNGELKREAALAMADGDVLKAEEFWRQALALESNDAEVLIYRENQRVAASGHPYTTFVVGTFLKNGYTGSIRDNLQGAYLVQKEQNEAVQRYGGTMLRLAIAVSEFSATSTTLVAEQVVQLALQDQTLVGVMGWPLSNQTLAALKVLEAAHLPMVSPTATSDQLTEKSPYFFRVVPSDTQQAEVAANYIKQVLQNQRVALFEDQSNPYSHSLAEAFRKSFVDETHSIIYHGLYTIEGDSTLLAKRVQEALAEKPDLLYLAGYVNDASIVVQHLPPCSPPSDCLKLMGGDGLDSQGDYSLETYKSYGRILYTTFAFADKRQEQGLSEHDRFFKDYAQTFDPQDQHRQGTYGYNLADTGAMLSYDATQVLLHASKQLQAFGKTHFSGDDLRLALTKVTGTSAFQGVSGSISFGPDGNVIGKVVLVLVGQPDGRTDLGYVRKAP